MLLTGHTLHVIFTIFTQDELNMSVKISSNYIFVILISMQPMQFETTLLVEWLFKDDIGMGTIYHIGPYM
jgi:hypothetical protein